MLCPTVTLSLGVAVDCCGLRQRRLRRKLRTCVRTYRWKVWGRLFHGWASRGLGTAVDLGHCHRGPLCVAHATGLSSLSPTTYGRDRGKIFLASYKKGDKGKKGPRGTARSPPGRQASATCLELYAHQLNPLGTQRVIGPANPDPAKRVGHPVHCDGATRERRTASNRG